MKKLISLLLTLAFLLPGAAAFAAVPGEAIGDVLYTDVVATIDGFPIRSYNIAGETYVVVEDLMEYGFTVSWLPDVGKLVIDPVHTGTPDTYTTTFKPTKNTVPAGTPAMKYLYTQITTWIGERQITGYNIGGFTCCRMDDLAEVFAETYVWDPATITLRMTTKSPAPAGDTGGVELPVIDVRGRVRDAEDALADYLDELTSAFRALDPALVGKEDGGLDEFIGAASEFLGEEEFLNQDEDELRMTFSMWKNFGDGFSYKILGSSLGADGVVSVTAEITAGDFFDAYFAFVDNYQDSVNHGMKLTDEQIVRLLYTYLAKANDYAWTRQETIFLVPDGDDYLFTEDEENYEFIDSVTGYYFLLLDTLFGGGEDDAGDIQTDPQA